MIASRILSICRPFGAVAKVSLAILLASFAVACDISTSQVPQPSENVVLGTNDVVAIIDSNVPTRALFAAAKSQGYQLRRTTDLRSFEKVMLTFEKPADVSGADAIAFLEAAEPASVVGINHAYRLQQDRPPADPRNYAQGLMEWPVNACRARMPIGLIDTSVDPDAPGVRAANIVSRHFGRATRITGSHGTQVASVLADPRRLKDAKIYSASVMTPTGDGDLVAGADALIEALEWLVSQNVRVVNISLAGPFNKILKIAVDEADARGLTLVASVGNFGSNAGPFYPAAFDPVIAATAVDANARIYSRAVRGSFVDVAAPGVDIFIPSDEGGRFVTGTSFAAPFVTARIAADPEMIGNPRPEMVRTFLADASEDLGPSGIDRTYGAGLLKGPEVCK